MKSKSIDLNSEEDLKRNMPKFKDILKIKDILKTSNVLRVNPKIPLINLLINVLMCFS